MTENEIVEITQRLLDRQGISGWTVQIGTARGRAGSCDFRKNVIRFSKVLAGARTYEGTLDTIRHEVAHAIAGYSAAHGSRWREVYREMGGTGDVSWDHATLLRPEEVFRWAYTCSACGDYLGKTINRHRYAGSVTRCCGARVDIRPINQPISRREAVQIP